MADTPKILGQLSPVAATPTKLYTGAVNGAVARLVANNRPTSAGNAQISIELRIAGAGSSAAAFIWEGPVAHYEPLTLTFAVGATDEVWVTTDIVGVSFNLTGIEP